MMVYLHDSSVPGSFSHGSLPLASSPPIAQTNVKKHSHAYLMTLYLSKLTPLWSFCCCRGPSAPCISFAQTQCTTGCKLQWFLDHKGCLPSLSWISGHTSAALSLPWELFHCCTLASMCLCPPSRPASLGCEASYCHGRYANFLLFRRGFSPHCVRYRGAISMVFPHRNSLPAQCYKGICTWSFFLANLHHLTCNSGDFAMVVLCLPRESYPDSRHLAEKIC